MEEATSSHAVLIAHRSQRRCAACRSCARRSRTSVGHLQGSPGDLVEKGSHLPGECRVHVVRGDMYEHGARTVVRPPVQRKQHVCRSTNCVGGGGYSCIGRALS